MKEKGLENVTFYFLKQFLQSSVLEYISQRAFEMDSDSLFYYFSSVFGYL